MFFTGRNFAKWGNVLMFENERELKESEASRWEVLGMIKQHPVITISVLVLVIAGLFFVFRSSQATPSANKPEKTANINKEEKKLPVEISTAKKGAISSSIVTTASLEPDRQVTMVSETTGIVTKILVDEGDSVKEGQLLATFSDAEKQVALQKAIVHVQSAKQELERKQASVDQKIISQSDYEKAKYEMDVATSEKNSAQVDLDRATIRAPFAGVVTARFIEK
jgi:membrane fusion protein (multidrug efflux system)